MDCRTFAKLTTKNSRLMGVEKMEILGLYRQEPAIFLRPKMARINMIRSSGGSETPSEPPQGLTSASERVPIEQQH